MSNARPEDAPVDEPGDLAEDRDGEEIADEELPLDPTGPTELGDAIEG